MSGAVSSGRLFVLMAAPAAVLAAVLLIAFTFKFQSEGPIGADVREAKRNAIPAGGPGPKIDPNVVAAHGIVEPLQPEARLTADVAGRISGVFVSDGDHVEKGVVLAEIENQTLKAQLNVSEAQLAEAQAQLERTMHGLLASDVNAIVFESNAAQAKAKLAQEDLARTSELAKTGTVPGAELEQLRQKEQAAQSEYAAASSRAATARGGSRREDILMAQAHVRAAEATRDGAKAALARTLIVAPFAGDVLRVKSRIGEFHNPGAGEPVLVLGDVRSLRVRLDVDERDIARTRVGAPAYVTAIAAGDKRFPGKVVEVAKRMGRRTVRVDDPIDRVDVKILEVVVLLDDKPALLPGQRVEGFVLK